MERPGCRPLPWLSPIGSVDFPQASPSIRPRKGRGLLGANGFAALFPNIVNGSPRVAAFLWRRIEGRTELSTLPVAGGSNRGKLMADRCRSLCGWLLAGLSGALASLSFPTYSFTPLIFIALVPLLLAVGTDPRRAFVLGWVTGSVGHVGTVGWVLAAIARFENISWIAALPFFGLFVAYQALPFGLLATAVAWARGRTQENGASGWLSMCLGVASWWVVLEWAFPNVLPWSLGEPLATSPLLRQAADVAGVHGLSFVVAFINTAIAAALMGRGPAAGVGPAGPLPFGSLHRAKSGRLLGTPLPQRLRPLAAAATVLICTAGYGAVRIHTFAVEPMNDGVSTGSSSVSVAIVQGALPSGRSDLAAANEEAWITYSSLSASNLGPAAGGGSAGPLAVGSLQPAKPDRLGLDADLVVWPETVLRVYLRENEHYQRRVFDFVRTLQRPLLLGSLDRPRRGPGELNSAYLFMPEPREHIQTTSAPPSSEMLPSVTVYHKASLLPFGEYVPGATWLPLLGRWETTGAFVAGQRRVPLSLIRPASHAYGSRTRVTTLAPSICFEAIEPGAFNPMVRDGAEVLVNLTDDGWFGDSAAPYQHLHAAALRAVETRRWLVRASNSGISAFIDPTGQIVASLPWGQQGVLTHNVGAAHSLTPYVRFGDWLVPVSLAVVLGAAVRLGLATALFAVVARLRAATGAFRGRSQETADEPC